MDWLTFIYMNFPILHKSLAKFFFFFCRILFPLRWTNAHTTMNTKLDWERQQLRYDERRRDKLKDIYLGWKKWSIANSLNSCCTIACFIAFILSLNCILTAHFSRIFIFFFFLSVKAEICHLNVSTRKTFCCAKLVMRKVLCCIKERKRATKNVRVNLFWFFFRE